ncbi:MAG: MgtE intracellular region [Synergistaceae bacterium]|nr:MgtE intracellular region [Synergistaceae bacterium]
MPDEPRETFEDISQESTPRPKEKKEKRKGRKGTLLFLFLLLAAGTAAGLHFAGAWDARPLLYNVVPRLPWIGPSLGKTFGIPKEYTLTSDERRRLELERWSDRLSEREMELKTRSDALDALSADVEKRAGALEDREQALRAKETKPDENSDEESTYMAMLMKTYEEISPRKAAQILEQLREDLAVRLLAKMSNDVRASILGRMDAGLAAQLTERLAAPGRP